MDNTITELGLVLGLASALGLLARWLKQPPLLGFIAAGFILGPLGATRLTNPEVIELFSQMGIVLLLFLVGLELNWEHLRRLGRAAINLALLQISLTFALGYSVGLFFGFNPTTAGIIGLTLTFSSTIVVLQLISAKNDVSSLYGQLSVSLLLIQDLAAVIVLVLMNGGLTAGNLTGQITLLIAKLAGLFLVAWLIARYIMPHLYKRIAKSRDLLVLASLAWCFVGAIAAHYCGFSYEIGAFVAGLALASLPYATDIFGQIRPLRDFFIVLFFVLLGLSFNPGGAVDWGLVAALVLVAVLAKPFIILISLASQRFRIRTSFFAAFSLGQMSEFSVILAMAAASTGYITSTVMGAIIIATSISFALSAYIITAADRLYHLFKPILQLMQLPGDSYHFESVENLNGHIIIFGYHRTGFHILKKLQSMHEEVVVVDFNPDIIAELRKRNIPSVFGDASDPELLETIHLTHAKLLISTIPHIEENMTLIAQARATHKAVAVIVTAEDIESALILYRAGADYVMMPKMLTGEHVADLLDMYKSGTLRQFLKKRHNDKTLQKTTEHDLYL